MEVGVWFHNSGDGVDYIYTDGEVILVHWEGYENHVIKKYSWHNLEIMLLKHNSRLSPTLCVEERK